MSVSQLCFRILSKFPLSGTPSVFSSLSTTSIFNYIDQISNRGFSSDVNGDEPPIAKCKVAIVTGGAAGIGLQIVKQLVMNGTRAVIMADVNEECALANMEKLNCEFGEDKVLFQKCDVTKREELEQVFECTKNRFHKIDIVVNNAGILADCMWEKTICINVYGVVLGTLLGFEYMGNHNCCGNGGIIINVASILGLQACHGSPVYAGSKHFGVGFTRSIGDKWFYKRTGVKVMGLLPGVTTTDMTDDTAMIDMAGYKDIGEAGCELSNMLHALPTQPPEECAKCVIHMLKNGKSGDLWVTENCECFRVAIPDRGTFKIKGSEMGGKGGSGGGSGGPDCKKAKASCGPKSGGDAGGSKVSGCASKAKSSCKDKSDTGGGGGASKSSDCASKAKSACAGKKGGGSSGGGSGCAPKAKSACAEKKGSGDGASGGASGCATKAKSACAGKKESGGGSSGGKSGCAPKAKSACADKKGSGGGSSGGANPCAEKAKKACAGKKGSGGGGGAKACAPKAKSACGDKKGGGGGGSPGGISCKTTVSPPPKKNDKCVPVGVKKSDAGGKGGGDTKKNKCKRKC